MMKWLRRIGIILAFLSLAYQIVDALARRADSLPAVPKPNGYETLLVIANDLQLPKDDLTDLGTNAVQQIARANRGVLEKLHDAVRSQTGVPLAIERRWVDKHAEEVKKLKRLGAALGIQSRADLLNGNTNSAVGYVLDMILLGQVVGRGGILSDGLNGLVIETIATEMLRARVNQLDSTFCRSAAHDLEQSELRRDEPEQILKTQKDWSARSFGLVSLVGLRFLDEAKVQRHAEFIQRYHKTTKRTRELILMLAARALELESGQKPQAPSALVPSVLQSVPIDPETHAPMTGSR